ALVHNRASRGAPTPGSGGREPALTASTRGAHPSDSTPTACSASPLGQGAVDLRSPILHRLARASVLRHTRNGRALASSGLAAVLALEVPLPWRTSASQSRGTGPDREHVSRQPALGHRADQRRAAEAGHCGQQSLDWTLSLARTGALT